MSVAERRSPTDERDRYGPPPSSAWLEIDWREHQRWVSVQDGALNVIEMGSGPPLLFVHGLGGSWTNWLENIPYFARTHRVVAVDLPGFGASPRPRSDISITSYAKGLDELCDALEIERTAVVGNSMGGFIGAELTLAFPTRVEKLVLVSAAGISSESQRREPLLTATKRTEFAAAWFAARSDALVHRPRLRRLLAQHVVRHPERLPAPLTAELVRGAGTAGFVDALDALLGYEIRERLGRIECPTLIVWGRSDWIVPPRDAKEFERLIPRSRRVMFDETGHVPMLERPARFNSVVEEFLAE